MVLDGSTRDTEGIVMDPFLSAAATSNGPIQFVRAGAEDFINSMVEGDACSLSKELKPKWWRHEYDFDQVLMKEKARHLFLLLRDHGPNSTAHFGTVLERFAQSYFHRLKTSLMTLSQLDSDTFNGPSSHTLVSYNLNSGLPW